jgi:mono/diheme cytochrome c family protein
VEEWTSMSKRFVLLSFVAVGCGGSSGTGDDGMENPQNSSLKVVVSMPALHWTDGVPETSAISAILVAADGTETDVTADTQFTLSPADIADVATGTLTPTGQAAGAGIVYAQAEGLVASGDFTVNVTDRITGTGDANASLFQAATLDSGATINVAYPPAGAMIPPNLGEMDVHWRDATKDVYEVQLSGGYVTLRTYVARTGMATWFTLADARWKQLSSGARGVDLAVRVRGIATASPGTFIEGTQTARIAAEEVKGGVYYWNTTKAAIMRFDMSTPAVPPEQFYPKVGQSGCVGCHAVSRDGKVVAYREEGDNMNYGNSLDVASQTKHLDSSTQRWNFAAVHPSNTDLFTTADNGLFRTDLATKARTALYTGARISHPDVNATGDAIVATQVSGGNEVWTSASKLVIFDYDQTAKTVAAPRTLVQPAGAFPYYPSFSPDNAWVLYNQATSGTSYDNANAQLWVTKADGSLTAPIRLTQAEVSGTYNSWPKWTPFMTKEPLATGGEEPVIWFTVASRRAFGVRSDGTTQKPQLWLAPFYPERALAGQPASGPAIRLPFQVLNQGNHIAQWTQQIVTLE